MQNYGIGLSGLRAAQVALDVIGNNVANAATDGYHRQRVELAPLPYGQIGELVTGAGVDVAGVTRMIDRLLEREILQQDAAYGQVSKELSTLSSIETVFGEFGESGGLNATIDAFFDALRSLAAHPLEQVWRNETVSTAEVLASEFRRFGHSLRSLQDQILLEAKNTADSINVLTSQIAELNGQIQRIEIGQGQANNLRDQRDQLVAELAQLAGIETLQREHGVVDVAIAGLAVVMGTVSVRIEVGLRPDRSLGVSAEGSEDFGVNVQDGRLGALITLRNDLVRQLQADLDTLARAIINQVNKYHVQGVGLEGSFAQLTGWAMDDTSLSAVEPPITDGTFYLRLTNTTTGEIERYAVDVDVSGATPDTPASIAAKIDAITGVTASVVSSKLHIVADLGYTFDFAPAVSPEPTATNLTGTSPPTISVSGICTDEENQTLTFTVVGSGSVGNGSLRIDVTDQNGDVVDTLNVGAGYAAGDVIELRNGIKIAVSLGDLNNGDGFDVDTFATTDTSGFLAAAGINAFFSGAGASDMHVCSEIVNAPDRIATAMGGDLTDNLAALRLAGVRDEAVGSLGDMTPSEYYHRTVAGLGQQVALKQTRQENLEAMIHSLEKRRSDISSVNINDEAAQLIIFEKMFQAVAKYLGSLQTTMTTLMDIV